MTDTKREKLKVMAARGGTSSERDVARKMLEQLPAVRGEEADDEWGGQGVLTRTRKGVKAYLRGSALRHFLKHVRDNQEVTYRSVGLTEDFGNGDFYVIVSWLIFHGLCEKMGSRYRIATKKQIVAEWNAAVEGMRH